jgi:hypothetical protein
LQGEKEPAGWRRVVAVIGAAPGVDVDHPIGRHHHLPGVTDVVGEHRCAKARGQRNPAVVAWTALSRGGAARILRSRWRGAQQQHPEDANADSDAPRYPTADEKRLSHHVHCVSILGNRTGHDAPAGVRCGEVQQMSYGQRPEAACAELPQLPGSCGNVDDAVRRSQIGVIKIR